MAPTLRLTMPDRHSLRFGRRNTFKDMEVDAQWFSSGRPELPAKAATSAQLPSISRLDTRSFVSLFEKFEDLETHVHMSELQRRAKHQEVSLYTASHPQATLSSAISPLDAFRSHSAITTMVNVSQDGCNTEFSHVAGGDSTASPSSSRPTDSDTLSYTSKRSSRSSFALDSPAKPLPVERLAACCPTCRWCAGNRFASAAHPDMSKIEEIPHSVPQHDIPQNRAAKTNKPLPPDPFFDKPRVISGLKLQPELGVPPEQYTDYAAKPDHIRRPSTPVRPAARYTKSASVADCPKLSSFGIGDSPSPRSSRGSRLGKAMTKGLPRHYSDRTPNLAGDLDGLVISPTAKPRLEECIGVKNTLASQDGVHDELVSLCGDAAENIVLQIMYRIDDLRDLQSTAMLSRGFYSTFKRHEPALVSHVVRKDTPPAWEMMMSLQNGHDLMSIRTLNEYRRTLDSLRATILVQCEPRLKGDTFAGLIGANSKRRQQLDCALWRIWLFCELFGRPEGKHEDFSAQVDWLNGGKIAQKHSPTSFFGLGNGGGLSIAELEDISEMWHCMSSLLKGFQNRTDEARLAGIFSNCTLDETNSNWTRTEEWYLEEWIHHLLCLGPAVVSSIPSCSFEHADALGLTTWSAPTLQQSGRSSFLNTAITAVYQERVVADATLRAAQISLPRRASHRLSKSDSSSIAPARTLHRLQTTTTNPRMPPRLTTLVKRRPVASASGDSVAQIPSPDNQAEPPPQLRRSSVTISPISNLISPTFNPISPNSNPTLFHALSMTPTASTRLGATLFPVEHPTSQLSQIPTLRTPESFSASMPHPLDSQEPQIIDPVDKAVALLVHDMGFAPADAKRALASCDTGFGMDVEKAIEMLSAENEQKVANVTRRSTSGGVRKVSVSKRNFDGKREGDTCMKCGCASSEKPQQQQPQHVRKGDTVGLGSGLSILAEEQEDSDPVRMLFFQSSGPKASFRTMTRTTSKAKAYKVLGVEAKISNGKANRGLGLSSGMGSIRQKGQLVKTLSRGMGTIKMPNVGLHVGISRRASEQDKENDRTGWSARGENGSLASKRNGHGVFNELV